jgi:pSer/pThr/pTyr-binding forkhead associated (FHA) protein
VLLRFRISASAPSASRTVVERTVELDPAGAEVRIGRRSGVDLELPFPTVSGLHARLVRNGEGWEILDVGSANGTFVGHRRLPPGTPHGLREGETIRLADVTLTLEPAEPREEGGADQPDGIESTATLARRLVNDLFQAGGGLNFARLVVEGGPDDGAALVLALPDRDYTVGRARDCALVLRDDDVSRVHAGLTRRWDGVFVRDLGSKNGIELSGVRIAGERRVHDGETILVGGTRLRLSDPEERYLRSMQVEEAPPPPLELLAAPAPGGSAGAPGSPIQQGGPSEREERAGRPSLVRETAAAPGAGLPGEAPPSAPGRRPGAARAPAAPTVAFALGAVVLAGAVGLAIWLFFGSS